MNKILGTRDLIFSFLLAKGGSLFLAFYLTGPDSNEINVSLISHAASVVLFFCLLIVATKKSGGEILSATIENNRAWGRGITWLVIAIPLGFLVRFGCEGVYLAVVGVYDKAVALNEFNDLIKSCIENQEPMLSSGIILVVAGAILGAFDEEFIYRKIFLWHFCVRYNMIAGILISSCIFGLVHLNPIAALAAFCLACIYIVSGRLWVAVIAHAAGNLFHPFVRNFTCRSTWDLYFSFSVIFAIVLVATMALAAWRIRNKLGVRWACGLAPESGARPTAR